MNFIFIAKQTFKTNTPPLLVTTPPNIKCTAGKLLNFAFSAGIENTMTGKENFLQSSAMELVQSLTEKQKFQRRNNRNKAGKC